MTSLYYFWYSVGPHYIRCHYYICVVYSDNALKINYFVKLWYYIAVNYFIMINIIEITWDFDIIILWTILYKWLAAKYFWVNWYYLFTIQTTSELWVYTWNHDLFPSHFLIPFVTFLCCLLNEYFLRSTHHSPNIIFT